MEDSLYDNQLTMEELNDQDYNDTTDNIPTPINNENELYPHDASSTFARSSTLLSSSSSTTTTVGSMINSVNGKGRLSIGGIPKVTKMSQANTDTSIPTAGSATGTGNPNGYGANYCRKDKSLGLLCDKFLEYCRAQPDGLVSLDHAATYLGVERRRIYDVTNILEALDIVSRRTKNQYTWHGTAHIHRSVKRLLDSALIDNNLRTSTVPTETLVSHPNDKNNLFFGNLDRLVPANEINTVRLTIQAASQAGAVVNPIFGNTSLSVPESTDQFLAAQELNHQQQQQSLQQSTVSSTGSVLSSDNSTNSIPLPVSTNSSNPIPMILAPVSIKLDGPVFPDPIANYLSVPPLWLEAVTQTNKKNKNSSTTASLSSSRGASVSTLATLAPFLSSLGYSSTGTTFETATHSNTHTIKGPVSPSLGSVINTITEPYSPDAITVANTPSAFTFSPLLPIGAPLSSLITPLGSSWNNDVVEIECTLEENPLHCRLRSLPLLSELLYTASQGTTNADGQIVKRARRDRSLGVLTQRFLKVFLLDRKVVTLDFAANYVIPEDDDEADDFDEEYLAAAKQQQEQEAAALAAAAANKNNHAQETLDDAENPYDSEEDDALNPNASGRRSSGRRASTSSRKSMITTLAISSSNTESKRSNKSASTKATSSNTNSNSNDNLTESENQALNTQLKARRLYDIANVLCALRLIDRVHVRGRQAKKPAFRWRGPAYVEPIQGVPVPDWVLLKHPPPSWASQIYQSTSATVHIGSSYINTSVRENTASSATRYLTNKVSSSSTSYQKDVPQISTKRVTVILNGTRLATRTATMVTYTANDIEHDISIITKRLRANAAAAINTTMTTVTPTEDSFPIHAVSFDADTTVQAETDNTMEMTTTETIVNSSTENDIVTATTMNPSNNNSNTTTTTTTNNNNKPRKRRIGYVMEEVKDPILGLHEMVERPLIAPTLPTPITEKLNGSIMTNTNTNRNRNMLMDDENFMYPTNSTSSHTDLGMNAQLVPHQTSSPSTVTAQALLPRGMTIRVIDALLTSESPQVSSADPSLNNTVNKNGTTNSTTTTTTTLNVSTKIVRGDTPPPAIRNRGTRADQLTTRALRNHLVSGPNLSVASLSNSSLPTDTDFAFIPTPVNNSRIKGVNNLHSINSAFMGAIREPLSTGLGFHFGPPLSVSMGMTVPGSVGIGLPSGIPTMSNYPHSAHPHPNNLSVLVSNHPQFVPPMSVGVFSSIGLQAPLSTGFGLGTNALTNHTNSITSSTSFHSSQVSNMDITGSSLSSDGLGRYVIGKRRSRVNPSDADLPRPAQDFEAAIMGDVPINDNISTTSSSLSVILFSPFADRVNNNEKNGHGDDTSATKSTENIHGNMEIRTTVTPDTMNNDIDNLPAASTPPSSHGKQHPSMHRMDDMGSIGMDFSLSTASTNNTLLTSSTTNSLNTFNPSTSSSVSKNRATIPDVISPAMKNISSAVKKGGNGHPSIFSPTKGTSTTFYPEVMKDIPTKGTSNEKGKDSTDNQMEEEDILSLSRLKTSQVMTESSNPSSNPTMMNIDSTDPSVLVSSGVYTTNSRSSFIENNKLTINELTTSST